MYMTPSQNYTSGGGNQQSILVNRASKNAQKAKAQGGTISVNKAQGSSPTALSKKISYDNSLQVQNFGHAHGSHHQGLS